MEQAGTPLTPITRSLSDLGSSFTKAPSKLADLVAQTTNSSDKMKQLFLVLLPLLLLGVVLWGIVWLVNKLLEPLDTDPVKVQQTITLRESEINKGLYPNASKSLYSELIRQLDPSERYFVNLCPMTAMWPGYIGPVSKGVFSPKFYVQKALDAGIRSFVLPISWHKKPEFKAPQWPAQLRPGCMVRDVNQQIISINGMSVKQFVNELFIEIGNRGLSQRDEPLLLTFVTTPSCPDRVRHEADYVRMICQIGEDLNGVSAFMSQRLATLGSYGSATGGAREQEILLQTPLEDLKNKVLVLTDFDTKLVLKDEYKDTNLFPRPSLYDFVNIHLHMDPACCAKPGQILNGKMIHMMDISGSKTVWRDEARTVWTTTLADGPIVKSPTAALVENAHTNGIQMVPIPFFLNPDDNKVTKEIWDIYKGYSWRVKPANARYSKPAPIEPAKPSAALNARVSNNLQPGQTQIT